MLYRKLSSLSITLIAILFLFTSLQFGVALGEYASIEHDGEARSYYLYVPESLNQSEAIPLIVALHPSASSGKAMAAISGLNHLADKDGYLVVYPDALDKYWDDGRIESGVAPLPQLEQVDDMGYIEALIQDLSEMHNIDPQQIFLTGMGGGGTLAYRLACEMPETFAGIAVVSTLLWNYHPSVCPEQSSGASNLLVVHGSNDPIYTLDGRILGNGNSLADEIRTLGVNETMEFWAEQYECDPDSLVVTQNPTIGIYGSCGSDTTIAYYGISGGGHNWGRIGNYNLNQYDVDVTDLIGNFFAGDDDWADVKPEPFEGQPRSYVLYVPPQYSPEEPMPIVVTLHGRPSNGVGMAYITDMNRVAAQEGFIVVYPDGIDQGWNYTRNIPFFSPNPIDDADFLSQLLEDLSQDIAIDQQRIYVTGFSNGGFMTERLACEAPDQYAAFATVGATAFLGMSQLCEEQESVPFLLMHGTNDVSVPWDGTISSVRTQRFYTTAPIPQTLGFWASHIGCEPSFSQEEIPQLGQSPNTLVNVFEFEECDDTAAFIFYAIEGGGHNWPGVPGVIGPEIAGNVNMDIHASEVIWSFFEQYSRDIETVESD